MIGVLPQPVRSSAAALEPALLDVQDLRTEVVTEYGVVPALAGVSFQLRRGRTLALVGETGSGKSMTAYSLLRLLPPPGRMTGGRILLRSRKIGEVDVAALAETDERLYRVRGGVVGLVFQEALSCLSPVHAVGAQISEALRVQERVSRAEAKRRAVEMLDRVGLPEPQKAYGRYPHELSGGMRQRAVMAMALVCKPELVIADEPTSALDVTTQIQVLHLLRSLQEDIGCALLLITHDMGVVSQVADEVAVMYYGEIVEQGSAESVLNSPLHPYTRGLLKCLPTKAAQHRLNVIPGSAPTLLDQPAGCPFHARCAEAVPERCGAGARPGKHELRPSHWARCHRLRELNTNA